MSASDIEQDKARHEQELRIQRQITFASGLFQSDVTVRTLLESLAEGVVIIDNAGTIMLVNTAVEQMFGYQRLNLIGTHFSCFYPEEEQNAGKPEEKLKKAAAEGRFEHEGWRIRKDGSRFWADVTITALCDESGILRGFSKVTHDITARKKAEEELRHSEERYRSLYKETPVMLHSIDHNGRLVSVSNYWLETLGYERSEVLGRISTEFLTAPSRSYATEVVLPEFFRTGSCKDVPYQIVKKNGEILDVLLSATAERDSEGKVVRSLAVMVDVTERKRTEEALKNSDEKQRYAATAADIGMWHWNLVNNELTWSERCKEIFGYPPDYPMTYEAFLQAIHEEDRQRIDEEVHKALQEKKEYFVEMRVVVPDGKVRWVMSKGRGFYSDNDKPIRMHGIAMDITERKRSEEALLMRTSELEAIFQAFPDIYFWVDNEERIIDYKAGATAELYTPPEAFLGKRMQDVLPPDVGEQMHVAVQQVLTTGAPTALEYWLPVRDGKQAFEARLLPLPGNQAFFVVRNITTRKWSEEEIKRLNTNLAARAADLEDANLELEAFNYTVAHDLRQPLNIIGINCQAIDMLYGDQLQEECKVYVRDAYNSTLRMNQLIEDLLNFSHMAHVEPRRDMIDLSGVAQEVAAELTQAEPARRVALRIKEGITAIGDASLLRVVLDNLIGNAWKYTGTRDEAIIEFGTTEVNEKPAYFVRDNGAGFDMTNADKLFIPFKRLPSAEECKCRGFGIGLATVERIIRRHGGRVWAEGAPDEGSCFYFTLSAD